jgi:hypothetical protein
MFDTKAFLKWLVALLTGAAAVALAFLGEKLAAFDPSTVASDPLVAGVVVVVIAAAARGVGWLVSKLPA